MRNPVLVARLLWKTILLAADLKRLDHVLALNALVMQLRTPEDERQFLDDLRGRMPEAEDLPTPRFRFTEAEIEQLATQPAHTLGGAYGRFMLTHGLTPEALPSKTEGSTMERAIAHLYDTHDLWHVATGFGVDPAGEAALQAFYLAQMRAFLPLLVLPAILINTGLSAYEDRYRRMDAIVAGWLAGRAARPLFGVDWSSLLDRPLQQVRSDLGLGLREVA